MSNSSQQCWSSPTRSAWHNTVPMRAPSRKLNMICSRATCWLCHGGAGGWSLHVAAAYSHGKGGCDQQGRRRHTINSISREAIWLISYSGHTVRTLDHWINKSVGWKLERSTWMHTHACILRIFMPSVLKSKWLNFSVSSFPQLFWKTAAL
jgi:hypothetical protein